MRSQSSPASMVSSTRPSASRSKDRPSVATCTTSAREALVGDDQVGPAPEQQQRLARRSAARTASTTSDALVAGS